jgi:hypothetical protein
VARDLGVMRAASSTRQGWSPSGIGVNVPSAGEHQPMPDQIGSRMISVEEERHCEQTENL